MKTVRIQPRAKLLLESLRDIGYSLDTALADVIDNSIAADATRISVLASTVAPDVRIGVIDNGRGMDEEELLNAMRPGSRSPLDDRNAADLGRFGLGLKTASFSQCRRLTVVTRKGGKLSAARWDLDRVAVTDDWVIELPDDPLKLPWADQIPASGTLVLWEDLDRLIDATGSGDRSTVIDGKIDDAVRHLELVFHRYLSGEKPMRKNDRGIARIAIDINGRPLEPLDPFFRSHSATDCGPPDKIGVKDDEIHFQTFTLPHHSKVTPAEWERHAGPGGYARNQGFYVYREKRLILHGTWFGLARQTELTKLARVRIDLTNRLDTYWKIDVKKASAQPPQVVRERLRRIIEQIGASSKRVYTARGKRLTDQTLLPIWCRKQSNDGITYALNSDHPIITEFRARLPDSLDGEFERLIETIGSAMPMDALFADLAGDPEKVRGQAVADDTLSHLIGMTVKGLRDASMSPETTVAMMRAAEPFRSNWERAEPQIMCALQECGE